MPIERKLRVVQVIPSLGKGGAERLILDISRQLILLGHGVTVICFRKENDYPELSVDLNIEVIPSQVVYSITGNDVINTADFDRRIREIKPDILHSHLLEAEFVTRQNPLNGVLYITHWHGCHPPTNQRRLPDYFKKDTWWNINSIHRLKKNYTFCDNQFLCISEFIRRYVKRALSTNDDRLNVILNGTNLENFSYQKKEKNTKQFTMVAVGSFHIYKNQIFLLKVMKHLKSVGRTDFSLQLLGDGAERQNLQDFVDANALNDMVEFKGYVSNPGEYMNRANALVHSAIDEPFGLILLEAMSCKLPIVAFKSGGIPEIVEHNKTGLLTEVNDIEAFAEAMQKLNANGKLCEELGSNGSHVVQDFEIGLYVKRIENLYFDLLNKQSQ
ncbi:MAG: glycosyltransferase involved in cell wall biosynthesis [Flavobacteriales bacterium]|jgi:glycosyltransferase involved in cell wall biosynthesis